MDSAVVSDRYNLPPGFRFHPTDEELLEFFLSHKVLNGNHSSYWAWAIPEVDLNSCEPWDLPEVGKEGDKDRYIFTLRDRKYASGTRSNRATKAGYWKATGKDRRIFRSSGQQQQLIGMKKTLVFYIGRAPKGQKTNWIMHEYRLEEVNRPTALASIPFKEWVICRVFLKTISGQNNFIYDPVNLPESTSCRGSNLCSNDSCLPSLVDFQKSDGKMNDDHKNVHSEQEEAQDHVVSSTTISPSDEIWDIEAETGSDWWVPAATATKNFSRVKKEFNGDAMSIFGLPTGDLSELLLDKSS